MYPDQNTGDRPTPSIPWQTLSSRSPSRPPEGFRVDMSASHCSRVFAVMFVGLVIGTAGFCLTLAGWFAPPINESVRGVRLAGLSLLFIGLLVLFVSCLLCAISQQLCCPQCVHTCYDGHPDVDVDGVTTTIHVNVSNHETRSLAPRYTSSLAPHPGNSFAGNNLQGFQPPTAMYHAVPLSAGPNNVAQGRALRVHSAELQRDRLRSLHRDWCYEYTEGTTDSEGTPTTLPSHRHQLAVCDCSPAHVERSAYQPGRTKGKTKYRSTEAQNTYPCHTDQRAAYSSPHSAPNTPYSSPHFPLRHAPSMTADHVRMATCRTCLRPYPDLHDVPPGTEACRAELGAPAGEDLDDPVWTPRTTHWNSPRALHKNIVSPHQEATTMVTSLR